MHLNRFAKPPAVFKNSFTILTCLFLALCVSLSGCSKKEKSKQPEEEKPVVTEMNIPKKPAEAPDPEEAPKADEIESLPLESEDKEEQLPELGSGG